MCNCANECDRGHATDVRTVRAIVRYEIARYDLRQRKARGEKVAVQAHLHGPFRVLLNGKEPELLYADASEIEGWVECWPAKRLADLTPEEIERGMIRHYGNVEIELIEE